MKLFEKLIVFSKAQASALMGGTTDYLIMIFFTEVFHVHYTISIVIGGIIGAVVNFSLNRGWTFHSKTLSYENSVRKQFLIFMLVVFNSVVLKITGTFLITTTFNIDYKISRLVTDLIISIIFNYSLQKYWVFRKAKVHE